MILKAHDIINEGQKESIYIYYRVGNFDLAKMKDDLATEKEENVILLSRANVIAFGKDTVKCTEHVGPTGK